MSRSRRRQTPAAVATPPASSWRRWAWLGLAAVGLLVVVTALLWQKRGAPASSRPRLNVLLITLDTTRADHIGVYGYAKAKTRYLDGLAREGVMFSQAYATAPITLPSHASIFTALLPPAHGVRNNGNFYVPERLPTLTSALKAAGYRTGAFVSSFILDRRYGLARGFDVYDDHMQGTQRQVLALEAERRGDRTALALGAWLEQQQGTGAPWFAWLHLYDPHEPYAPPRPFRDLFADALYDGEIAFDDAIVASVLDKLGQLGMKDRTLIAVVADHGESLGEHGEETHSMFVYECDIRVPMILWRPGRLPAGTVVDEPVSSIDLAPTLLEMVGAAPLAGAEGRSLTPLWNGQRDERTVYAETYLPQFYMNWAPLRTVREARYKLIDAPRPELFDLAKDPQETDNLHDRQRSTADALRRVLERTSGGHGEMSVGVLDREALEKLAALGYVGATAQAASGPPSKVDPKDFIAVFNRLRRANSAVRDRRFDEALPILEQVLRDDPGNAFARLVMGSAYMGMGESAKAIPWFRRYLERVPTSSYAHLWIAICLARVGAQDEALREAEAALALDPKFSDARILRAGVLASRGQHEVAIQELRQAIANDPAKPMIRLDLAKILAEAGRRDEARAEYDTVLRMQPDDPSALTGLGVLQASGGALADAERSFRRALARDPAAIEARFDLAEVLARQGRKQEAAAEYRALAARPDLSQAGHTQAQKALAALR